MILCICNYKTEEDIEKMCKECKNKKEFIEKIKEKYKPGSCKTCYKALISKYEEGKHGVK